MPRHPLILFRLRSRRLVPYVVVLMALVSLQQHAAGSPEAKDQFTPLIASVLTPSIQPEPGTDGKYHLVYELVLMNTRPVPATLDAVEVLKPGNASPVATFDAAALASRLRTLDSRPAKTPEIEFNGSRVVLIDVAFDSLSTVPAHLVHKLQVRGAGSPADGPQSPPTSVTYIAAPLEITSETPVIGPPLEGTGWVALNGCCEASSLHRGSGLPVNGRLYFAQRFAIDWMRVDTAGRLVNGSIGNVQSYVDYGANVLAVADGTIVGVLDKLDDQIPPNLPDPRTITIENVDGNHIVIDIGQGRYAFYAHLQKGSVKVQLGEHVTRGEVLAKLGNTGNTSGPHLHFHLMDGPSVLGSSGLPYVIDGFAYKGMLDTAKFEKATTLDGVFYTDPKNPSPRKDQFPLDLNVVDFPSPR